MSTSFVPAIAAIGTPLPLEVVVTTPGVFSFDRDAYLALGYTVVDVEIAGGGGGGGGGESGTAGTIRRGGCGGGGGGKSRNRILLADVPVDAFCYVGEGGTGGADSVNGNSGSYSTFYYGSCAFVWGGVGGKAGSNTSSDTQPKGGQGDIPGTNGGVSGDGIISNDGFPIAYTYTSVETMPGTAVDWGASGGTSYFGGGGGSGGSIDVSEVEGNGGEGAPSSPAATLGGPIPGGNAPGGNGLNGSVTAPIPVGLMGGGGGGGGGAARASGGDGGDGGDGGRYGGGGGGGGAATTGQGDGGTGGDGHSGLIVLILS